MPDASDKPQTTAHPMQPVIRADDGVIRFKANAIIEWLFETRKLDLNEIAVMAACGRFSTEDQMQLAQLLGYSVSGYGDLPYASEESVEAADKEAERIAERPPVPAPMRSSRSDKDYAIEFAGYLAASAERYQAAVNSYHSARDGDCDQSEEDAVAEMTEAYTRLSSDIYEFRKRAERANANA